MLSRRKRVAFACVTALLTLLVLEAGSRLFWKLGYGVGFWRPRLILAWYPELAWVDGWPIRNDDENFDVLLLGGSVLHPDWGFVREVLFEELTLRSRRPLWIHNLAQGGHTSLDSFEKYRRIGKERFDVVVAYEGLNDVRANNCPPEVFRSDYTHFARYADVQRADAHPEARFVTLPFTVATAWARVREVLGRDRRLPVHRQGPEWTKHGSTIRTAEPFERHVEGIVETARRRGERLVLATFAWHLPAEYDLERFHRRELDYCRHGSPVELWGEPANVAATLRVHNEIVRRVAARHGVPLVDEERLLPRDGALFNDLCHLSHRGCAVFAANLADAIAPLMGRSR